MPGMTTSLELASATAGKEILMLYKLNFSTTINMQLRSLPSGRAKLLC